MLVQPKTSEIVILVIVSLMSFIANLPNHLLGAWIDQRLLLATLAASVLIALLRHLRALLSMSIAILAIGANLPDSLAAGIGVSPVVMTLALATVIVLTLVNKAFKLLPSGLESVTAAAVHEQPREEPRIDTTETRLALLATINRGDCTTLHRLLDMNLEVNFSLCEEVPILLAAEKGHTDIIRALLMHGVDSRVRNKAGKTALEITLERQDFPSAEILFNATRRELSRPEREAFVDQFFIHQRDLEAN